MQAIKNLLEVFRDALVSDHTYFVEVDKLGVFHWQLEPSNQTIARLHVVDRQPVAAEILESAMHHKERLCVRAEIDPELVNVVRTIPSDNRWYD